MSTQRADRARGLAPPRPVTAIYSRNEAGSAGRAVEVTSMTVEAAPDEIMNWQAVKAQ